MWMWLGRVSDRVATTAKDRYDSTESDRRTDMNGWEFVRKPAGHMIAGLLHVGLNDTRLNGRRHPILVCTEYTLHTECISRNTDNDASDDGTNIARIPGSPNAPQYPKYPEPNKVNNFMCNEQRPNLKQKSHTHTHSNTSCGMLIMLIEELRRFLELMCT